MTLMRARILTPWAGTGTLTDPYRPTLAGAYALRTCLDVTGQPGASVVPSPNAYAVEVVCTDAVLQQIEGDGTYAVLWSETT